MGSTDVKCKGEDSASSRSVTVGRTSNGSSARSAVDARDRASREAVALAPQRSRRPLPSSYRPDLASDVGHRRPKPVGARRHLDSREPMIDDRSSTNPSLVIFVPKKETEPGGNSLRLPQLLNLKLETAARVSRKTH